MEETLKYIENRLATVREFGLEAEVIAYALKAMKEDNNLSIDTAFEYGCEEWDV